MSDAENITVSVTFHHLSFIADFYTANENFDLDL